jgi:hypothetical protein
MLRLHQGLKACSGADLKIHQKETRGLYQQS